jgi:Tfp pilus assembly pilus retraction ATPase PilT
MIQSGQKYGMKTMNQSLAELQMSGKISLNEAMLYSHNTQELGEMLSRDKSPAMMR